MTSLLHTPTRVHPSPAIAIVALPETVAACHSGLWCYRVHPADTGRWCPRCLRGLRDGSIPSPEDLAAAALAPCESEARYGAACYLTSFGDRKRWCPRCLAEVPRGHNLPEWMERATPDAPGEPRLPMADWIEVQASLLRLKGSNLAEWLAGKLDDLAEEARSLDAETPDQFEARSEVMARDLADWDHEHSNGYGGVASGADYTAEDYRRASHGF